MDNISERTRMRLLSAGWHLNRVVPIDELIAANHAGGFFVSERARAFLREYGYLQLTIPHPRLPEHEVLYDFDASWAARNANPELIAEYEQAIHQRLTIIGEGHHGHSVLTMDSFGRIYGGFESTFYRYGITPEEALTCICEVTEVTYITLPSPVIPPAGKSACLSKEAYAALERAGWVNHRQHLGAADKPSDFALQFGNIWHTLARPGSDSIECHFREVSLPPSYLAECSLCLGVEVRPIGELGDAMVLLMDAEGRVIAGVKGSPSGLWLVGTSGIDAINNLVAGGSALRLS